MNKIVKKNGRFTVAMLCLVVSFCTFANKVQAQADSLLLISDGMDCEILPMKKQKSGDYEPFGYIKSTDYAFNVLGNGAIFSSSNPRSKFYTLFPDSLTVSYSGQFHTSIFSRWSVQRGNHSIHKNHSSDKNRKSQNRNSKK